MTDPTARKAENDKSDATAQQTPNPANPKPYVMPDDAQDDQPDPLVAAQREAAEYKDKLLRTLAEMENLRKRTEREVADARTYGITGFARDVLTVADNMNRALENLPAEAREAADASLKAVLEGIELTERELLKALEKNGVKQFTPQGEKFDPNKHQAMFEMPTADVPPGHVAQVIQSGYMIGERMLRPALVGVSKGQPKVPQSSDNSQPSGAGK
jgi:molecular chaperone GrpE